MKTKDKNILSDIFKTLLPLVVSGSLVAWLLHKVSPREIITIVRTECDFVWIAAIMLVSVFSFMIRGIRWGIQLRSVGLARLPVSVESASIFGAYSLNLLLPFLGEAWRAVYIAKEEKAKVSSVVGTLLGDRFSDAIVVVLLFALSLFVAHDKMVRFFDHYSFGENLMNVIENPWFWLGVAALCVAGFIFVWLMRKKGYFKKTWASCRRIWQSFAVLFHLDETGMYILLTLGIWVCYFLETYLAFFAFPFTRELITQPGSLWGLLPGLVAFVFGSMSIAIPSNGGLGPWNVAVTFSLTLYGISQTDGVAFTMVVWAFKSLMIVLLGIYTAIFVAVRDKAMKKDSSGNVAGGN